jgi:hypothetical protein
MPGPTITCIYCKEEKLPPARGEHVVLAGLGGKATIPDVCQDCNSFLGNTLDREFLRSTHVALDRFFDPEVRDGELASPQFQETEFGFLDVRLHNSGQVELLPQILLHEGHLVALSAESDRSLVDQVLVHFANEKAVPHVLTRDVPQHDPTRLVVDRNQKSHLIRTANHAGAEALLELLHKAQRLEPPKSWVPVPNVRVRISTDVNVPGRCAAKMAFNMASYVVGPDVMLGPEFDGVRDYILGKDVLSGPSESPSGEPGVRIDYRHVDPWLSELPQALPPRREHSIVLELASGVLMGHVLLRGGLSRFRVRLGRPREIPERRLPAQLVCRGKTDWWLLLNDVTRTWAHTEPPMWPVPTLLPSLQTSRNDGR